MCKKELTLSRKSCDLLNTQVRRDICKRIIKFLKKEQQQQQTIRNEAIEKILSTEIHQIQHHLKQMENLQKIISKISSSKTKHLVKSFDKDLGEIILRQLSSDFDSDDDCNAARQAKIEDNLIDMLFDGFTFENLNDLIKSFDAVDKISIKSLIKLSLNKMCVSLKRDKSSKEHLDKLQTLLDSISNHLNAKETIENPKNSSKKQQKPQKTASATLINDEDVMECMRFFCNDHQIDINIRLFILEELKKSLKLIKDEDLTILLVHKTNAILTNCQRFDQKVNLIDATSIENETARESLILTLISLSQTKDHGAALISLLKSWPQFTTNEAAVKPWSKVFLKLLLISHSVSEIGRELKEKQILDETDLNWIRGEL
jgi:hypothetical protein